MIVINVYLYTRIRVFFMLWCFSRIDIAQTVVAAGGLVRRAAGRCVNGLSLEARIPGHS